jgi:hypothetical protein
VGVAALSIYSRLYDFLAGATVRSQEFDDEFNAIATHSRTTVRAVDEIAADLPNAAARANKLLSFDASGNASVSNTINDSFTFGGTLSCADPAADSNVATRRWVQTLALTGSITVGAGDAGKVLSNNGATLQWTATDNLFPSMAGNAGKVLTNNGSTVQWTAQDGLFPSMVGNAGKFLYTDGAARSWTRPVITIAYDNRGDVRSLSGVDLSAWVAVEGLGLFQHFIGSTDGPDDDETAFATASGYWLLICPSWEVVDAYTLAAEDYQDTRLNSAETRLTSAETRLTAAELFTSKMFRATSAQSAFSLAINSSTTFTVTVTGAVVGASVIATPPSAPTLNTITMYGRVSSADTVTVYVGNANSTLTGGFSAGDWQITVINK